MKNKKIKILIVILIIILIIPFIYKKIFFYNVREKYLNSVYEATRNGNYHLITSTKNLESNTEWGLEETCKDGKKISFSKDENGNITDIGIEDFNETIIINVDSKTGSRLINVMNNNESKRFNHIEVEDEKSFKKIEKGKYDGKDCYIAELEFIENNDVNTKRKKVIYINPETYLPFEIKEKYEDKYSKTESETVYKQIDIGTVEKLPEINLDEYNITTVQD